jgi:hypothetical protein
MRSFATKTASWATPRRKTPGASSCGTAPASNGSIQVVQGGGASVTGSRIGGTLLYENRRFLRAARNVIDSDLQTFQNKGGVWIARNRVDGNLQCKANRPRPRGFGNIVQGNKEDQCARL